jgi:hypothetical protein
MSDFTTIRTVGGLLPPDLLARVVAGDRDLAGLTSSDYHLAAGETPREAANRAWSYLTGVWATFRAARDRLPAGDPAVGLTRERWLLVLLRELGYGRIPIASGGIPVHDRAFPVSHLWERTPMHLLGWGVDLDRRTKGVAGAAERAPHAMLQELLNRSDSHLWGMLSNGRVLRVLRDSTSLSGQSYLEFDLEAMFDGEVFSDFVVLFLVAHQSRVELGTPDAPATDCWLERWRTASIESGTRALGMLRDGVKAAIEALGTGFLQHPANGDVNRQLADGELRLDDYQHALLRLVYRLLFLFVAEDRQALHHPDADAQARSRYATYFSIARLRRLALKRRGTKHTDLWQPLTLVVDALGNPGDAELGLPDGIAELGLPGLGGIFEIGEVDVVHSLPLPNDALLAAVRHLAVVQPKGQPKRTVDYRNLGAEELGSIYESLLELVPRHDAVERIFTLQTLAGNDRKTSGSYYTPSALIDLVLDEALDPVLDDAEKSATTAEEAEKALLAVTVCDPACGSGHFLVAAARRIAHRLAVVRTGDVDPTPTDLQTALHDVVARCIYGIDINPLAAELAKVSLWLEALQPGRPLTFLDAHIRVGNALLGTTPALLAAGIPDEAFKPIEGDDKKWVTALRKRNQAEREKAQSAYRQGDIFEEQGLDISNARLRRRVREVAAAPMLSLADVHLAAQRLSAMRKESEIRRAFDVANTWCAAFVTRKTEGDPVITYAALNEVAVGTAGDEILQTISDLAARYRFFHWHLEFPEIYEVPESGAGTPTGWRGGFSCIVGNPPWDQVQLHPNEFFASRAPSIAQAPTMAKRDQLISRLVQGDPALYCEFIHAVRANDAIKHFVHGAGAFPLTSYGRLNLYSLFAEQFSRSLHRNGRAGVVTPTGLMTDSFNQYFANDLLTSRRLVAFYDFENEAKIFPEVHHAFRFALTCLTGGVSADRVRFAFYTRHISDVPIRRFELAADEVLLLNPNTGTLPVFRARADAEIVIGIYNRLPVLIQESRSEGNPWMVRFYLMFMMNTASHLFRTVSDFADRGSEYDGWVWRCGDDERWLPLYEAKLVNNYDHRYSTYEGATEAQLRMQTLPRVTEAQHGDPHLEPLARYWIAEAEMEKALGERWDRDWLFGWRDIARASDARTMIPSVLPRSAVGHVFPLAFPADPAHVPLLQAVWSSLAFDYVARQKLSGTHLTYGVVKQLACPVPSTFDETLPWADRPLREWVLPRVLELTYTSHRISGYARDILGPRDDGAPGQPFRWIPQRRELIRAELDGAMMHVYGLARPEVEHVLDSFTVVRKNERDLGEFRTKRLVLEAYDAMARAAKSGESYQTVLDPPPGEGPRHPAPSVG